MLAIACPRFERSGRFRPNMPIARHGANAGACAIVPELTVHCPRHDAAALAERCDTSPSDTQVQTIASERCACAHAQRSADMFAGLVAQKQHATAQQGAKRQDAARDTGVAVSHIRMKNAECRA
jgi:hypothetical protein